jgi:hypothetical protein
MKRGTSTGVCCVNISALGKQLLRNGEASRRCGFMQGRHFVLGLSHHSGTPLQKKLGDEVRTLGSRQVQRCAPVFCTHVHLCTSIQERAYDFHMASGRCRVKRRPSQRIQSVQFRTARKNALHLCK